MSFEVLTTEYVHNYFIMSVWCGLFCVLYFEFWGYIMWIVNQQNSLTVMWYRYSEGVSSEVVNVIVDRWSVGELRRKRIDIVYAQASSAWEDETYFTNGFSLVLNLLTFEAIEQKMESLNINIPKGSPNPNSPQPAKTPDCSPRLNVPSPIITRRTRTDSL